MVEGLLFVVVALVALAGAVTVVAARNPIHSALGLLGTLLAMAVLYVMQLAHLVAAVQVIVYAGAIMVLFIFAIMLLIPGRAEEGPDALRPARRFAAPVAAVVGGLMAAVVGARAGGTTAAAPAGGVADVGRLLFTDYLFPFEVTSVLLLAALIGALTLARRRPG